jgi:hypothetical protein
MLPQPDLLLLQYICHKLSISLTKVCEILRGALMSGHPLTA